jgi:hypothetical protein
MDRNSVRIIAAAIVAVGTLGVPAAGSAHSVALPQTNTPRCEFGSVFCGTNALAILAKEQTSAR